ncbi:signal peptidase II [Geotalea uraniireducens]|uniref:Lipoprotein signal peptidase n=1 Tax=Geotalea uraniireducens (strain Rf4) TaxID=351605 RepID=A5GE73_GEOUR|nr:signal peptidase II [Geotalea uraniireducens]ABQ25728.1 signal peptidase II, Aspartic peptidase, MEROPS family A08 [Geotalea uraniireducens Rf4]
MNPVKRTLLIAPVLLSCVGCDQVTKNIARHGLANSEPIAFLNNIFRLQYAENPGAFLSLGAGSPENIRFWVFTFFTGIFLACMLVYLLVSPNNSKVKMISLSLVVGGGIGNLIDRIFNDGCVIDFMNIGIGSLRTGVFNVADIAISFGVVWLFAISFKASKKKPAL